MGAVEPGAATATGAAAGVSIVAAAGAIHSANRDDARWETLRERH